MPNTITFDFEAQLNGAICHRAVVTESSEKLVTVDFLLEKGKYTTLVIDKGDLMKILGSSKPTLGVLDAGSQQLVGQSR